MSRRRLIALALGVGLGFGLARPSHAYSCGCSNGVRVELELEAVRTTDGEPAPVSEVATFDGPAAFGRTTFGGRAPDELDGKTRTYFTWGETQSWGWDHAIVWLLEPVQ